PTQGHQVRLESGNSLVRSYHRNIDGCSLELGCDRINDIMWRYYKHVQTFVSILLHIVNDLALAEFNLDSDSVHENVGALASADVVFDGSLPAFLLKLFRQPLYDVAVLQSALRTRIVNDLPKTPDDLDSLDCQYKRLRASTLA